MKTEKEVREQVDKVIAQYKHVLDCSIATVYINAPRALMQLDAITKLDMLYFVLGEERPKFYCDEEGVIDG